MTSSKSVSPPPKHYLSFFCSCEDVHVDTSSLSSSSKLSVQNVLRNAMSFLDVQGNLSTKSVTKVYLTMQVSQAFTWKGDHDESVGKLESHDLDQASREASHERLHQVIPKNELEFSAQTELVSDDVNPVFQMGMHVHCLTDHNRYIQIDLIVRDESKRKVTTLGSFYSTFWQLHRCAKVNSIHQFQLIPTAVHEESSATPTSLWIQFLPMKSSLRLSYAAMQSSAMENIHHYNGITKLYRFPKNAWTRLDKTQHSIVAVEEAYELGYTVLVPRLFLTACRKELQLWHDYWTHRYNRKRLELCQFKNAQEALEHGYDVYSISILKGANVRLHSSLLVHDASLAAKVSNDPTPQTAASIRETSSVIAPGKGKEKKQSVLNRFKSKAESWANAAVDATKPRNRSMSNASTMGGGGSWKDKSSDEDYPTLVNSFVVLKYYTNEEASMLASNSDDHAPAAPAVSAAAAEHAASILDVKGKGIIGKTNTEYQTSHPVWSRNENTQACPHAKPRYMYFLGTGQPCRAAHVRDIHVIDHGASKQFIFYVKGKEEAPSGVNVDVAMHSPTPMHGQLVLELHHEMFSVAHGVETTLLGEVKITSQDVAFTCSKRLEDGTNHHIHNHHNHHHPPSLLSSKMQATQWFSCLHPTSLEKVGDVQVYMEIQSAKRSSLPLASTSSTLTSTSTATLPATSTLSGIFPLKKEPILYPKSLFLRKQLDHVSDSSLEKEWEMIHSAFPLSTLQTFQKRVEEQLQTMDRFIEVCEEWQREKKMLKSSKLKKQENIQAMPINLHAAYFRVLSPAIRNDKAKSWMKKEELEGEKMKSELELKEEEEEEEEEDKAAAAAAAAGKTVRMIKDVNVEKSTLVDAGVDVMERFAYGTITCGAFTAHALGLEEFGLRERRLDCQELSRAMQEKRMESASVAIGMTETATAATLTAATAKESYAAATATHEEADEADDVDEEEEEEEGKKHNAGVAMATTEERSIAWDSPFQECIPVMQVENQKSCVLQTDEVTASLPVSVHGPTSPALRSPSLLTVKATKKPTDVSLMLHRSKKLQDFSLAAKAKVNQAFLATKRNLKQAGQTGGGKGEKCVMDLCMEFETMCQEYAFRKAICVSQSISSLIASFTSQLEMCLSGFTSMKVVEQMITLGYLIGYESLVSTQGKEYHMLSDACVAIETLEQFTITLSVLKEVRMEEQEALLASNVSLHLDEKASLITIQLSQERFEKLPRHLRDPSNQFHIAVVPILFTQGINEKQSFANMVNAQSSSIQTKINQKSFATLLSYYQTFVTYQTSISSTPIASTNESLTLNETLSVDEIEILAATDTATDTATGTATAATALASQRKGESRAVEEEDKHGKRGSAHARATLLATSMKLLKELVENQRDGHKNVGVLEASKVCIRSMHGSQIIYCKSGKDRTAMSLTLEQSKWVLHEQNKWMHAVRTDDDVGREDSLAFMVPNRSDGISEERDGKERRDGNGNGNGNGNGKEYEQQVERDKLLEEKHKQNLLRASMDLMRQHGCRIDVAFKNIGRYQYSFNSLQRQLLPDLYRPPVETIQDMVTSVSARDS